VACISRHFDGKRPNRRSASDQIHKPGRKPGNRSTGRGFVFAKPLTEAQPRPVRGGVTPNQNSFPFSTPPLPSALPFDSLASTCILNSMSSQSKSQSTRPAEAGFVFLKLRNNVAAHKNTPDATHDSLQSHPITAPIDGLRLRIQSLPDDC
jgi:hypothetical protein